jgi:SM-20-related protein
MKLISNLDNSIGESLREQGWWVGQILPPEAFQSLLMDATRLRQQGTFRPAAIGAQHSKVVIDTVRGDETCWVEGATDVQQQFLEAMLALKNIFESYFPVALDNFDGHYSYYPAGTFYRKHMDNARQSNSRIFSVVNYMNPAWQEGDGGELVLFHPENGEELAVIQPLFGTTAIFASTDFPHEVRETFQPRFSLTGWFHRRKNNFL